MEMQRESQRSRSFLSDNEMDYDGTDTPVKIAEDDDEHEEDT